MDRARRIRRRILSAGAVAISAVVVTSSVVLGGSGTLQITPGGADTGNCTTAPCATLAYAYTQADPGATIEIAGGTYGNETVAYRSGMTGDPVTVQPAIGADVTIGDLSLRASNVVFTGGLRFRSLWLGEDSATPQRIADIAFVNFVVDHQDSATGSRNAAMAWSTDNVTLTDGSIGNTFAGSSVGQESNLLQFSGQEGRHNTAWTVDGVRFHDNDSPAGSGAHNECVYALHVQGLTIRNSDFESCTYYGIFFTDFLNAAPGLSDVLIENNTFHTPRSASGANTGYSIDFHDNVAPDNFTIRHNTIENAVALGFQGAITDGFTVADNLIGLGVYTRFDGSFACKAGVTFTNNVMPNSCGTNTTIATEAQIRAGWAGPSTTWGVADDLHLLPGGPAVNAGSSGGQPSSDLDGVTRGSPSDAGAYELVSVADGQAPTQPGALTATGEDGQIALTWVASTDNVAVTGYRVHRSTSAGFTPSDANLLETVVGTAHDDTTVTPGTTYYYKVIARDAADNRSSASNEASASATALGGDTANIWVNTTAGGSPARCSSACAYSTSAAYGTWDAALDATNSGDIIRVKAGSYGSQALSGSKTSETQIIGEDPVVVTGQFSNSANFTTIENITVNTGSNTSAAVSVSGSDVTWRDVNVAGTFWGITLTGDRFAWEGGQTGGQGVTPGQRDACAGIYSQPVDLIDVDDVSFRNLTHHPIATISNAACNHYEYFNVREVAGNTGYDFIGLRFDPGIGTTTACIFLSDGGTGVTVSDVRLENSYFGGGCGGNGPFSARPDTIGVCANFVIAYNTFVNSERGSSTCTMTGTIVGNLGVQPSAGTACSQGTHVRNRWQWQFTGTCGSDQFTTGPLFSTSNLGIASDGSLNAGSVAINSAETPSASDYCTGGLGSVDGRDGTSRPQGAACDAGWDERP